MEERDEKDSHAKEIGIPNELNELLKYRRGFYLSSFFIPSLVSQRYYSYSIVLPYRVSTMTNLSVSVDLVVSLASKREIISVREYRNTNHPERDAILSGEIVGKRTNPSARG